MFTRHKESHPHTGTLTHPYTHDPDIVADDVLNLFSWRVRLRAIYQVLRWGQLAWSYLKNEKMKKYRLMETM